jgi:xanthine dehydrogenase accessory factor
MDRDTRLAAEHWLHEGRAGVVVEVSGTQGSAPREAGTRMLVGAAQVWGTIGGGHLEFKAIDAARDMLRSGEAATRSEHVALGPSLGQCCGGAVTLRYARLDEDELARWSAPSPLLHLQLHGAGHVGRAIATMLAKLDVVVDWIDERDAPFPLELSAHEPWPAHIRRIGVDAVEDEVRHAPPGAHYLVLTHNHDLDLRITEAILRRGDFRYLGLIGSKTKRQRFTHRFEQRGIAAESIRRMICPIGVEGISPKSPEVIAVAVVAQLLQHTDIAPRQGG